jgi:hypothetical protein
MNLMKYSNGMGHLLMSILTTITGLCLVLFAPDAATHGIGVTLILTVQGYWFVSGSAKQVAHEIIKALPDRGDNGKSTSKS